MPYAVYSKRTLKVNRIVHELSALLPSESAIEVDDEISFPKKVERNILGQDINSLGLQLFNDGGVPTIKPFKKKFDGNNRPYIEKHAPIFQAPTDAGGEPLKARRDVPIFSDPFIWNASGLAQAKYEAILAKNYPYQVVIGEEFITTNHIDTVNSTDYVLSEGKCILAPNGILQSIRFEFTGTKRVALGGTPNFRRMSKYTFDTLFFNTVPELPQGVDISWKGLKWSDDTETGWEDLVVDEQIPTSEAGNSTATLIHGVTIRFQNLTPYAMAIENYMLFLRLRNVHA